MSVHIRLLQLECYLPDVSNDTELVRALGPLKRHCKNQPNIALSVEAFNSTDRGIFSVIVIDSNKKKVEQDSEYLLTWIEKHIEGQSLTTNTSWL